MNNSKPHLLTLLAMLLLLTPVSNAVEISDAYVEGRLLILMTSIAEERYRLSCERHREKDVGYCTSLRRAIRNQPPGNDRNKINNFIARIFPNERFAADCQQGVDTVYELLASRPWPEETCDDNTAQCQQTLASIFGTQKPELIERALNSQLNECHYRGPSSLPFVM